MYECKASVYMTQGRVCPSLDNDFYVVAAPLSEEKEIEEGIPTEEELRKVRDELVERVTEDHSHGLKPPDC